MNEQVQSVLAGLNADHCLPKDTYFDDRVDAIRAAVHYVEATDPEHEDGARKVKRAVTD